jgi:ribosomal-protein-alanine N-acetyltransferase
MFELQRVRPDHEAAILDFELANRAYFAASISDRGDDYFREFAQRHRELLAEQEAGTCVLYVLVDDDGTVVGRFNLYDVAKGSAEVGYRVAQRLSGQGVATTALQNLCRIAGEEHGLERLAAVTREDNVASRRVLTKAGFVAVGTADIHGEPALRYELAAASP